MASAVSVDHRANRPASVREIALARQARRLADELESLSREFEKTDALSAIRRFMELHEEGNPSFDMLDAAKNLRSYAGILSLVTKSPEPQIQPSNARIRHTPFRFGQRDGESQFS